MATSARRTSCVGPRRAGAAGCRMRVVGRPGLRPRLLPEPPAAQVPVDAGGERRLPGLLRRAAPRPTSRAWTGSRATALEQRAAALAARAAAGARGRQVAGRIPGRPRRSARPCGALARALLAAARRPPGRRRRRLAPGDRCDDADTTHPQRARAPRLGQPRPAHGGSRGARCTTARSGRAIVPAGASKGTREALELRDGGDGLRRPRRAARRGPCQRRDRRARCAACDADDQAALDARLIELDGTPNKQRLGANATLAVSMAAAHAAAASHGVPLYRYLGGEAATTAAAAADPDLRRRRPCRPARRHPGLHGRVPGRRQLCAGAGVDGRGLPRTPGC